MQAWNNRSRRFFLNFELGSSFIKIENFQKVSHAKDSLIHFNSVTIASLLTALASHHCQSETFARKKSILFPVVLCLSYSFEFQLPSAECLSLPDVEIIC